MKLPFGSSVCLLLIALGTAPVHALDGTAILARQLGWDTQSPWFYYVGDIQEGGYFGWLKLGTNSISASTRLPAALPPAAYNFFVKAAIYDAPYGSMQLGLGTKWYSLTLTNGDADGYWAGPVRVTIDAATGDVGLRCLRTAPAGVAQRVVVGGFYFTTNLQERFLDARSDRIGVVDATGRPKYGGNRKGNLIDNGSFEVGVGHGWGYLSGNFGGYASNSREMNIADLVDRTVGYHGLSSFRTRIPGTLVSRAMRIRGNGVHTLSFSAKGSRVVPFAVTLYSAMERLPGGPEPFSVRHQYHTSTNWQRFSIAAPLVYYPSGEYHVRFDMFETNIWMDAIQFEEGEASEFRPKNEVEVGFAPDRPFSLFQEQEDLGFRLTAFNNASSASVREVAYKVYDYLNRVVEEGTVPIQVGPRSRADYSLVLKLRKRGIFRLVGGTYVGEEAPEEVVFGVVPRRDAAVPTGGSIIGTHPDLSSIELEMLKRMGITSARLFSPASVFRWGYVEPTEGQFVWHDAAVARAADRGFALLGTIGGGTPGTMWPKWAESNGLPRIDKWEKYVETVVRHYRGKVKYWEIWNEPIFEFSQAFYAEILKAGGRAVRRGDPNAKIVGIGGVYDKDWVKGVLNLLGPSYTNYLDVVSTHLYPPKTDPSGGDTETRAVGFRKEVSEPYKLEVWNSETGVWDQGFYRGRNANYVVIGESLWPFRDGERFQRGSHYEVTRVLANVFHTLGNGLTRYFYYDARFLASPDYLSTHATMLEYDDSIRAKGIALSVASSFLQGALGLGNASSAPTNTFAYAFTKGSGSVGVLWARDSRPRTMRLNTSGFTCYDAMGNPRPVTAGELTYGRLPVYVEAPTVAGGELAARLKASVITLGSDTSAPGLSIDEVEVLPGHHARLRARWGAIDETWIPDGNAPDALTYSYRIEPLDAAWSEWGMAVSLERFFNRPGSYQLLVRARDRDQNVSSVASRGFVVRIDQIGAPEVPPIPPRGLHARED